MKGKSLSGKLLFSAIAVILLAAVIATPVLASPATATRALPASVAAGAEFDVTVTPSGCGAFGQVVETLPDGFTYLSCTPSDIGVKEIGNTVKFTFLASESFTYRVEAPTVATTTIYTFHGIVKDENSDEYPFGDNDITVTATVVGGGGGGGGSGGGGGLPGITNVIDSITESGRFTEDVTAKSEGGKVKLNMSKNTIGKKKGGQPLRTITIIEMEEPPAPPENSEIIGLTYDLNPDGATFDPPITLTFTYDPDTIPEGVDEEELVLAWWDAAGDRWVELESTVDTATHTIIARVGHFTTFAVIGYEEVELPPEPAAFTLSSLTISPTEVNVGEEVSISIMIANTGGELGSYEVTLKINSEVEATEEVPIAAGSSQQVSFTTSKDTVGTYIVDVGGLTDSFVVKAAPPVLPPVVSPQVPPVVPPVPPAAPPAKPINWWLIGGIMAAVIITIAVPLTIRWHRRA